MRCVYLLTLVVVLMLCLEQIDAKKGRGKGGIGAKGKGKGKGGKGNGGSKSVPDWDKGYAKACKVMIGDEIVVPERTCGCDTETDDDIGCTIEASDRTINGQTEKRTFCDVTRDELRYCDSKWPGLCSVTIDGEALDCNLASCDDGFLCTLNPPAKYNDLGQLVQQTYCYKDPGTRVFTDFEGTLENACEIHYLTNGLQTTMGGVPCERGECDTGDENAWTGFTYQEDTQAQAFFCIPEARCDINARGLCRVFVDGEEDEECTRRCDDGFECELNAPVRLNEQGEVVQQRFCYKEPVADDDKFEGKMGEACKIKFTDNGGTEQDVPLKDCGTNQVCQTLTGPGDLNAWTNITYQGDIEARAFFCTSTCVKLPTDSAGGRKKGGKKGGKRGGGGSKRGKGAKKGSKKSGKAKPRKGR